MNAPRIITGVLVAILAWGTSGTARAEQADDAAAAKKSADERKARFLQRHPDADADGDGNLTREEMAAYMKKQGRGPGSGRGAGPGPGAGPGAGAGPGPGPMGWGFDRPDPDQILRDHPGADTNKDGKLDPEEMRAFREDRMADMKAELLKQHPELDTDGDGALSPDEMRAGRETIREFMHSRGGPGGVGPGPAGAIDMIIRNFARIDTDGNGQLSREELEKARKALAKGWGAGRGPRPEARGSDSDDRPGRPDGPGRSGKRERAGTRGGADS